MIKRLLISICLIGIVLCFVDCKKCVECKASYKDGITVVDEKDYCGKQKDLDALEKTYIDQWNNTLTSASCDKK
jgi:hypothetical protein